MPLPTSSLSKICNAIREHIDSLGLTTSPADWEVTVTIGAPGINQTSPVTKNTLNLFFYRFEPFGFAADALPGDVQWVKMFCIITAFGVDEDIDSDDRVDFSAGFNELRMLSQVMRLFQEQPVMLIEGDDSGEVWHTQIIQRPLADEHINQIWSTQGDTIYRPSLAYEIALAPIEPVTSSPEVARVASIGAQAHSNTQNQNLLWPTDTDTRFPAVPSITVDTSNPQWAPAIVMVSGTPLERQASLSINFQVPGNSADADFSSFPEIDIWIAGDSTKTNDITIVGQLLQNPDDDKSSGHWIEISPIENLTADVDSIDINSLPAPAATHFTLQQSHWTGISASNHSWQLQLFAERHIKYNAVTGLWTDTTANDADIRIRSNPLLISLTRELS
ncbi:MAG: DUF4255 domain-containing protein [Gammaproteobacteria bacterium]|nr:DUF4255 domain-containing protein [Gammaproteobacteria bacterium]